MVVIAACGDEAHAGHVAHDLEADQVVVEAQRILDVSHVQMNVAHLRARGHRIIQVVILAKVAEEFLEVDRITTRAWAAVSVLCEEGSVRESHGPVLRRFDVDLDAVPIGIPEIVRLGHDVVRGRLVPPQAAQAGNHARELASVGHHDGKVVQA